MKWFKHDATANMDHKLQDVLLEFGLEGYGLYWYCLEMIAGNVKPENLTFQLDHDVRMIARNVGSTPDRVREILAHFVKVDLFRMDGEKIVCAALAKRCDDFTAKVVRSSELKEGRKNLNNQSVGVSRTKSDKVRTKSDKVKRKSEKVPLEVDKKRSEDINNSLSDNSDELPGQAEQDKTAVFLAKYPEAVGGCYTPSGSKWGSATDRECAQWIYDRVLMVNSAAKEPNWPAWSNDIRLMRQADGRNHKEICELFKWANQDSFWQANILSPGKLREKWDTLAAKRNSGGQNGNGGGQSKMSRIMNNINDLNW